MVIMNNVNTTERLIQEVRERPPLWDQRNLNYHNRVVVNALWQEIANLLQVNKETVKVKWKGLRDTYRRELKKQRSSVNVSTNNENTRDPSWTHYGSMNFLREYMGSNNNHADLFQFHGWSTEDMVTNDITSGDDVILGTMATAVASADTMNESAMSNKVKEEAYEDEIIESNERVIATLQQSQQLSENVDKVDMFVDQLQLQLHKKQEKQQQQTFPKRRSNERKRLSAGITNRLCRFKEHRLRTKFSRKLPSKKTATQPLPMYENSHQSPAPDNSIHNHDHYHRCHRHQDSDSDDDLYFFKSLIPYVKHLPTPRKLYLRAEIHNLVLREVIGENSSNVVIPLEHVSVGLNA